MTRTSLVGPIWKSALFILVTVLATAVLAFSINDAPLGDTHRYQARFTDVTGLAKGDTVRIAGVTVGEVQKIEIVDRRNAQVTFTVRREHTLPASATAAVRYQNLVGQRYVALGQGTGEVGGSLRPGGTIPLERTTPALDLTLLFNGFQPLFEGLSPNETNQLAEEIIQVLQGEGATVTSLIRSIGSLTSTLAAEDEVIGSMIENLNTTLETVNSREEDFTGLVETLTRLVAGFAEDREPLGEAVEAMGALAESTAGLFSEARDPLRQDIEELGRLSGNLAAGTPQMEEFLRNTPVKMEALARLASYGSWFNLYLCEAHVSGVTTFDGSRPPTGLPVTEARCAA
jgi:phospholipid/cholesterol/gamma-HCH transport system substrate-binding protein